MLLQNKKLKLFNKLKIIWIIKEENTMNYINLIENVKKYNDINALQEIISSFNNTIYRSMEATNIINQSDCYDRIVRAMTKKILEFDTKNIKKIN